MKKFFKKVWHNIKLFFDWLISGENSFIIFLLQGIFIVWLILLGYSLAGGDIEKQDYNYPVVDTLNAPVVDTLNAPVSKNLVSPNLTGKEYLGNGVYRYREQNGITMDYDVYNGCVILNGTTTTGTTEINLDLYRNVVPNDSIVSFGYYYVSGTFENDTPYVTLFVNSNNFPNDITLKSGLNYTTSAFRENYEHNYGASKLIPRIYFGVGKTVTFNNFTFKLQLEKGTRATDYEVPKQALEQHIQFEKDNSYNDGFNDGSSVNIVQPSSDMTNDVWLDGNQVNDVYYRNDIVYDGITYTFFEEIQQAYIDKIIPANTLLYIELNPMYNYIFAKQEDQGNGLYYWSELGTLNPEELSFVKTIVIDKDGVSYKNQNYNSVLHKLDWGDFDTHEGVRGNSLIGYVNQFSEDYYNYNNGYNNGYQDGKDNGYDLGKNHGIYEGKEIGWQEGYGDGKDYGYGEGYKDGKDYGYDEGYDKGYDKGLIEQDAFGFSTLLSSVFVGLGSFLSINLLPNISIGAIIAVPIVFGIIYFIIGKRKGD